VLLQQRSDYVQMGATDIVTDVGVTAVSNTVTGQVVAPPTLDFTAYASTNLLNVGEL